MKPAHRFPFGLHNSIIILPKIVITCSSSFCCYCAMAGRTRSRTPQRIRPSPIQVCVRDLNGNILIETELYNFSCGDDLQREIQTTRFIDERLQTIYFNGTQWKGTQTAHELGVHPNAEITLITLQMKQKYRYSHQCHCQRCNLRRYCDRYVLQEEHLERYFHKRELYYCDECQEEVLKLSRKSLSDEDKYVRNAIRYRLKLSKCKPEDWGPGLRLS